MDILVNEFAWLAEFSKQIREVNSPGIKIPLTWDNNKYWTKTSSAKNMNSTL